MATPKVSIIVPVYNTEKYLKQCIDSITAQTLEELEIIIVDDGSKAECAELCSRFVPSMIGVQAYLNKRYGNNKYVCAC